MDDKTLRENILAEIAFEPSANAEGVTVTVRDGVVTLTGEAASHGALHALEKTIQHVKGVRAIVARIELGRGHAVAGDQDLAERAARVLDWSSVLPRGAVVAKVEDGMVTLCGEVEHHYQRVFAEQQIRSLRDVIKVKNEIALKFKAPADDLGARILEALDRNAIETSGVQVEVEGGHVKLVGAVRTWFDRDEIERVAWSAHGVQTVDNRLEALEGGATAEAEELP